MAKAAASPPLKVGMRNSDRSNRGCLRPALHRDECPKEYGGEGEADDHAAVAPGDLARPYQAVDQADQPDGEGGEPGPVGLGRIAASWTRPPSSW